ncbi:MAG: MoaD/ThiS family protein [Dinghuibacter sp.]|nr:MoaD/ThiS family protein [Dinghuibacter sp.]
MATIIIPTPLRKFTGNETKVNIQAGTVHEVLSKLTEQFPGIQKHIFHENGTVQPFMNVFAGDDDIRDLQNGETPVQDHTVISIVPAIAGGTNNK